MECEPNVRVEILKIALPLLIVAVPRVAAPSLNVTVPVAPEGVTVAVNVIAVPYAAGFTEDVNATPDACFTVCVSVADVLLL